MRWLPRMLVVAALTPLLVMTECIGQEAYEARIKVASQIHLEKRFWICTNYDDGSCSQFSTTWTMPHVYPSVTVSPP